MDTEFKLKGACSRALRLGFSASLVLLAANGLQAANLWSNGAINTSFSNANVCDSGPNSCGNAGGAQWTIFDNFNVPASSKPWNVSGFDFTDFLINTPTSDYKSTNWSIWNGDPFSGGKLVASGTGAVAGLTNVLGSCGVGTCVETFSVNFSSGVFLASGSTYYLGTTNVFNSGSDVSERLFAAGGNTAPGGTGNSLAKWEQSNGTNTGTVGSSWTLGSVNNSFPNPNTPVNATAFDINGTLVPEPATLSLLGAAFAGICYLRRRRSV